jgi:serine phosphatase RsbU (regulator of sigma subunit)
VTQRPKAKSLSRQLSLILILGVSIVSLIINGFIYKLNKEEALNAFENKNKQTVQQLIGVIAEPIWNVNIASLTLGANNFTLVEDLVFLEIFDENKHLLYSYSSELMDDNLVSSSTSVIRDDAAIGKINIAFSKNPLQRQLKSLLTSNLSIWLITVLTIGLLTLSVLKILLNKPLDSLRSISNKFGDGHYQKDVMVTYKEFHPMIAALSIMGKRISKQIRLLNDHKENLEAKVDERTKQLAKEKQFVNSIMDSQESLIITSNGHNILTINQACIHLFQFKKRAKQEFNLADLQYYPEFNPIKEKVENEQWLTDTVDNKDNLKAFRISINNICYFFTITIDYFNFEDNKLFTVVFNDITELESVKNEIQALHRHTRESIEYSALIQNSLIPPPELIQPYFNDSFVTWLPKDLIGGDIYLFDSLRNKNECLFMIIDCTGHGVPGAFMTMLVKAIEKQIVATIKASDDPVNTADIMCTFNTEIKTILKQDQNSTLSNAGFDGGVLYYNSEQNIIRYTGANTPLYYIKNDQLTVIKGDRYSVGYKKSDINYQFNQHTIETQKDMRLYLSTDGFSDQNGGDKGFPFGKKRFRNLIFQHYLLPMAQQQQILLDELASYQADEERNDDITTLGLKV